MDFWQVIERRQSVRTFQPDVDVAPEVVERLLAAATRAPSAGNRQPWHFYVVRDEAMRQALCAAANGQDDGVAAAIPGSQVSQCLVQGRRIAELHVGQLLLGEAFGHHH